MGHKHKLLRAGGAIILGSGRVVSSAGIQNLNIRDSFKLWNFSNNLSEGLAILAAISNLSTVTSTRVKTIYDKLPPKCDSDPLIGFSAKEKIALYTLLAFGVIESIYFVAGFFNAVLKMRCNLFDEDGCDGLAWQSSPEWLALATFCALSSEISFIAFNMPIIKKHGMNCITYMRNFRGNFEKENKKVIALVTLITIMSSVALSGQYYYSTLNMTESFFSMESQKTIGVRLQIPLAICSIVLVNIFTQVADTKDLLDAAAKSGVLKGIKNSLNRWYIKPPCNFYLLLMYCITPFLLLDTLFNGIVVYAGTNNLLSSSASKDLVVGLSAVNSVNSLLLYFAFNVNRALDSIAKLGKNAENSQPLLGTHSITEGRSSFFAIPGKTTGELTTNDTRKEVHLLQSA